MYLTQASRAGRVREHLDTIAGSQPLLQDGGELLGELLPVLLSHLLLKAVQDLHTHTKQLGLYILNNV